MTLTIFTRTYRSSGLSVYAPSELSTVARGTPIVSESWGESQGSKHCQSLGTRSGQSAVSRQGYQPATP